MTKTPTTPTPKFPCDFCGQSRLKNGSTAMFVSADSGMMTACHNKDPRIHPDACYNILLGMHNDYILVEAGEDRTNTWSCASDGVVAWDYNEQAFVHA